MEVLIIEDEKMVAEDLAWILQNIEPGLKITAVLGSVQESIDFLEKNPAPQLIFSDIQLGDGYSFEIFREFRNGTPVIYCTAYNEHALQAFENNAIAYVLKPYSKQTIATALQKYHQLKEAFAVSDRIDYDQLLATISGQAPRPATLLVNYKNKIIPVKMQDVAFFASANKATTLVTFGNEKYSINYTLEELEQQCGKSFFRANRQFLLNKDSVKEVTHYSFRKLFINLAMENDTQIIINKAKATEFLNWLRN